MESKNPRSLWIPKRPEVSVQCISCPFKEGNDDEFRKYVSAFLGREASSEDIQKTRIRIKQELKHGGDFMCHCTVYSDIEKMSLNPREEFRQCKGASEYFRSGNPKSFFVETILDGIPGRVIMSEVSPASPDQILHFQSVHSSGKCYVLENGKYSALIYDTTGHPYDFRQCGICNAGLGTI